MMDERLRLCVGQEWRAMLVGFDFSQGTTPD
jgi:hypothetical protein